MDKDEEERLEELYKGLYNEAMRYAEYQEADRLKQEYAAVRDQLRKKKQMSILGAAQNVLGNLIGDGTYGTSTVNIPLQELAHQQQQLAYQQQLAQMQIAGAGAVQGTQAKQVYPDVAYETGVLYLNGTALPEDWRGAYIDTLERTIASTPTRWVISFKSKWSKDVIKLYLDAEELSGKEAMKVAETYKETINQRRVG